ncbi:MAG: dihydrolipoyl dehydrogenase [Spirochaetes bacterium]|nr:dihydrolipoyl dehydrogenase [Spirochaetota bacterium]
MPQYQYDVAIVGAGPGGYVAAIRARQLGLSTAIIEMDKPGGVCLNIGCIPSKALIHQAGLYRSITSLQELGLQVNVSGFSYELVFKKSRAAAERLSKGVQFLLKKNGVVYIPGKATFEDPHTLRVEGKEGSQKVTASHVIIATGSRPKSIPGFQIDEDRVLSSTGALMLKELPKRLLILGAGAIGIEFAYVMNAFGVEVTVVEMLPQILPLEDAEVVQIVEKEFTKRGVKFHVGTRAIGMDRGNTSIQVRLQKGTESPFIVEADKVLVAVGRAPNTEDLGLERIGVALEKGFIKVGDYYETSVRGVYAVGDVVPTPLLAHVASKEGEIAVEHIAKKNPPSRIPLDEIPQAVYCEPEVASFGVTENEAQKRGLKYQKAIFPYRGVGKAVAVESAEGLVKLLFDSSTGEILGAHIVGFQATELIHEILLAKKTEAGTEDIATMIHAHPTLSEGVMEAARAAEGWAIHI